ncbi:opacity protein-like surface antigen [Litorivivens lipolytica]|uniref:Opacity protein-like surface antigen n=1 Tax=Litorivivens lipolytica TaxID=1524264 RepID=A0A7W4Z6U3_9GAMM|nr:outer membrane beta-barrel protein [Litorivivens lipolytica]MBB3048874.1 opacity protein-like surface antigen [Litorivivens lipolytica]
MKKIIKGIMVSALVASSGAMAQVGSFYAAGQIGTTNIDFSESDYKSAISDGSQISNVDVDDSSNALVFGFGYRATANVGFEIQRVDFGTLDADATSDGSGAVWSAGGVNSEIEVTGLTIGANFIAPVQPGLELYGRLGLLQWDAEVSITNNSLSGSGDDDGNDSYYGFGAAFSLSEAVQLTADFTRYDVDGDDFDLIGIGVRIHFGG